MELFGYKLFEKKSINIPSSLTSLFSSGVDVKPMNFETFYEMYRINADVKSCIRELQTTVAKSGFKIYQKQKNSVDFKEITENPFISSFLQETAKNISNNPLRTGQVDNYASFNLLKKEIIKHLKISGNVFLLKKRNQAGKIASCQILKSSDVNIVTDSYYNVLYYIVKIGQTVVTLQPQDVFHFVSTYDVKDVVYGISELSGLVNEVYADQEAGITNYHSMLNSSVMAGLYIMTKDIPQDKQEQVLKNIEKEIKGSKNRNKSIVSNAIVDYKKIGETNADMQYLDMRKFNSEKICSALGVSKAILSYTDGINYANGESQYKKYIENTVRPLENDLNMMMTYILSELIEGVFFEVIDNHINDKKEKLDIVEKAVANGIIARNEARDYLGYARIEDEYMDKITVNKNIMLIEDLDFTMQDNGLIPPNNGNK